MSSQRLEGRLSSGILPLRYESQAAIFDVRTKKPTILLGLMETDHKGTYWTLPGGEARTDESPYAAIVRHLKRQTSPFLPDIVAHMQGMYALDTVGQGEARFSQVTIFFGMGDSRIDIIGNHDEKAIASYAWFPLDEAMESLKWAKQKIAVWKLHQNARDTGLWSRPSKIALFPTSRIEDPSHVGHTIHSKGDDLYERRQDKIHLLPLPYYGH